MSHPDPHADRVSDRAQLLATYDEQLRTDAETPGAVSVTRHGPLRLVTFPHGRGFVTYRSLDDPDEEGVRRLVGDALAHFEADPEVDRVEWKSRGHDRAPGLHEALLDAGFVPEEPESVMLGEARGLAVEVPLPEGVTLRRVTAEHDVRAMCAMQAEVFADPPEVGERIADDTVRRLARDMETELWVAEADGQVVCAGRLEPVPGTDVAGIWGGSTRAEWRGRGIYRALTAARAGSALRQGKTLVHSDSTAFSRPILERSGLIAVTTTTPYEWRRPSS